MTIERPVVLDIRLRGWPLDVAAAAVVTVALVAVSGHIPPGEGERGIDVLGYVLVVLAGAAMALCRRLPAVALVVTTVVLTFYILGDYAGGPIFLTGWFALVSLSWRKSRRAGIAGAAVLCGGALILTATARAQDEEVVPVLFLVFLGWAAAAVLAGDVLRSRRVRMVELEERARDMERTREEEAGRRMAEERLRIARDIHDSVAHAMTSINVQAGAAAHVLERRPEAAKEALVAIQRVSGDVLDELGALLGLLRSAGEEPDRAPTPGLDRIPALVASARNANLQVALAIDGPVDAVPLPVGTAAYRIVQESLTNVIRHAAGATATVSVMAADGGCLTVEVADDGTGRRAAGGGTGMGIRGMRERAEATGGTLSAGPGPGGGWVVVATWGRR